MDAAGADDFFLADNDDDVVKMWLMLVGVGGLAGGMNVAFVKDHDEPATPLFGDTERIVKQEIDTKPAATRIIQQQGNFRKKS